MGKHLWGIFSKQANIKIPKLELEEISFTPFLKFKKIDKNADVELAWRALIEIMTNVISNTFDEYGQEKALLDSTYKLFNSLKEDTKKFVAPKSAPIILSLLNKEIRPFLARWNDYINDKKFLSDSANPQYNVYKAKFKKDYDYLISQIRIKSYRENLAKICNIRIKIKDYTDQSQGVLKLPS